VKSRNPPGFWTEEKIKEVAASCFNKAELKHAYYGAYKAAVSSGLINDLFPYAGKKVAIRKWGEVKIRNEAANYNTKREFEVGCPSAYVAANKRHPGLLSELFGSNYSPVQSKWDEIEIRKEAAKYGSRKDFARGSHGAYNMARKLNLADQLFPPKIRADWTEATVRSEAKKYGSVVEFQRECGSGYNFANRLGIVWNLGFPEDRAPSDNNAIYIWRAVGQVYNGNPVYKIGVTSARLGTDRIERCSRSNGFDFEIICCETVQCRGTDLEKKLLILGENPRFVGFDGCTEFRALSDSALYAAISLICGAM